MTTVLAAEMATADDSAVKCLGSEQSILQQYWVKITSPNGYEQWFKGDSPRITWTYGGGIQVGLVRIELIRGEEHKLVRVIVEGVSVADGFYGGWTVPSDIQDGDDYKVRISMDSVSDVSDSRFSISTKVGGNVSTTDIAIGGIIGGVILLALVIVIIKVWKKKRGEEMRSRPEPIISSILAQEPVAKKEKRGLFRKGAEVDIFSHCEKCGASFVGNECPYCKRTG